MQQQDNKKGLNMITVEVVTKAEKAGVVVMKGLNIYQYHDR